MMVDPKDNPPNPKQRYGDLKVPVHYVPPSSVLYEALALAEGARKYGVYNWREKRVEAMTYIAAALRHIYSYLDGEEYDPEVTERRTHHLGEAKACLGILIDCRETGNLIDNRPPKGNAGPLLRASAKSETTEEQSTAGKTAVLPPPAPSYASGPLTDQPQTSRLQRYPSRRAQEKGEDLH